MAKERDKKNIGIMSLIDDLKATYGESLPDVKDAGTVHRLPLSSPRMNYIFGGGYPIGRAIEIFGSESGGKSVIAEYIGGQFQNRKDREDQKIVLYIDMEHSFEKKYAETVGLDTSEDKFILVQPLFGEEAFTIMDRLTKTGQIGLIIYDSTTTTPTAAAMEDEYGKKSFGGSGLLFSEGLKKLNPYLSRFKTSLIMLTQMRAKVGFQSYGPPDSPSGGGYAPRFYASWRARVSRSEDILDGDEIIGNKIKIKNVKSKVGYPKRSIELDLYYASGFNPDAEYVDFMVQLGLIEKKGGWYSNAEWGFKVQGFDKILSYLYENPERFEEVKKTVNSMFTSYSALDTAESTIEDEDTYEVDENG